MARTSKIPSSESFTSLETSSHSQGKLRYLVIGFIIGASVVALLLLTAAYFVQADSSAAKKHSIE